MTRTAPLLRRRALLRTLPLEGSIGTMPVTVRFSAAGGWVGGVVCALAAVLAGMWQGASLCVTQQVSGCLGVMRTRCARGEQPSPPYSGKRAPL